MLGEGEPWRERPRKRQECCHTGNEYDKHAGHPTRGATQSQGTSIRFSRTGCRSIAHDALPHEVDYLKPWTRRSAFRFHLHNHECYRCTRKGCQATVRQFHRRTNIQLSQPSPCAALKSNSAERSPLGLASLRFFWRHIGHHVVINSFSQKRRQPARGNRFGSATVVWAELSLSSCGCSSCLASS